MSSELYHRTERRVHLCDGLTDIVVRDLQTANALEKTNRERAGIEDWSGRSLLNGNNI